MLLPLAPHSSLGAHRHHRNHLLLLHLLQHLLRQLPLQLHLPCPRGLLATATRADMPLQLLQHLLLALTLLARVTSVVLLLQTSLLAAMQLAVDLQLDLLTVPQDVVLHRATEMTSLARRLCL